MSIQINYKRCFSNAHALQARLNKGLPGNQWILKEEVIQTYMLLVKLLSKKVRALKVAGSDVPKLFTCGPELAALRNKSARTIRRHRVILSSKEVGLIEPIPKEEFGGSNQPFVVKFCPKHLGIEQEVDPKMVDAMLDAELERMTAKEAVSIVIADKMATLTDDLGTIPKLGKGGLEMLTKDTHPLDAQGSTEAKGIGQGHTMQEVEGAADGQMRPLDGSPELSGEREPGGGARELCSLETAKDIAIKSQCLWMMARELLWDNAEFPEHKMIEVMSQIRGFYQRCPSKELEHWHLIMVKMIGCASSYLDNDPERFIPLPWKWFNPKFRHGFVGTYKWYLRRERNMKNYRANDALVRSQRKWSKNEKASDSKVRPRLKVYNECIETISRHDRPDLVKRFNYFIKKHLNGKNTVEGAGANPSTQRLEANRAQLQQAPNLHARSF